MNNKLALWGGDKVVTSIFEAYNPYGEAEINAVVNVVKGGCLSKFVGAWCDDFYGGPKVQEFEKMCSEYFGVKHAITVNSWTSGLIAAVGALDVQPGDEVIVSPWTMAASATCILVWNAIPVFADIEEETFNINPESIEKKITSRTRAIVVPHIFGQSANMDAIMKIAQDYNLKVIEDAAQAPDALYNNRKVGTIGDIGGYSLNYHKHIHTGEGGVCVTNDDELADRMRLIRNHAEAVVGDKGEVNLSNMVGFNFRMGEIEAALGIEQLKKLKGLVKNRVQQGEFLNKGLSGLKGLKLPIPKKNSTHVYYIYGLILDTQKLGVSRDTLVKALSAEGVPAISNKYVNVHMYPMFQKKIAYGRDGFPWNISTNPISYDKGICPVAESLQDTSYLGLVICLHQYSIEQLEQIIAAFHKVWNNLDNLATWEAQKI